MAEPTSFTHMLRHDENLKVFNNTVPVGILVLRVDDGKVIFSNDFFFQTLGANGDQILGASWDHFFADSEERQKMMIKFAEHDEVRDFSLRLKRMDGEIIWGLASMSALMIEKDDLLLFSFSDTTPLKQAEAALQKTNDELRLLAEQQTRLNEKLKFEANVRKQFFSIISHDLKGPFTSLLGMTKLMAEMADRFDKDRLVEFASDVNLAGERVFKLLQNLLSWSRLQMDGATVEPANIDLKTLCEQALETLNPMALEKHITLAHSIPDTAMAFADPDMVLTVIRNLISNALKFTNPGGSVDVSYQKTGDEIQISITDTGQGMTPEQAKNIFKLDQKTSTIGTAGEVGTGLGLPLGEDMLIRNNGRIWVTSKIDKGSTFHFTLPTNA